MHFWQLWLLVRGPCLRGLEEKGQIPEHLQGCCDGTSPTTSVPVVRATCRAGGWLKPIAAGWIIRLLGIIGVICAILASYTAVCVPGVWYRWAQYVGLSRLQHLQTDVSGWDSSPVTELHDKA